MHRDRTFRCSEAPTATCLRKWAFGTDPFDEPTGEEGGAGKLRNGEEEGDGVPFLQENELTRLDSGRVGRRNPSLTESIRPNLGTKRECFRWGFKGVGEEEYRSLSMGSLSLSPFCLWRGLEVKDFAEEESEKSEREGSRG